MTAVKLVRCAADVAFFASAAWEALGEGFSKAADIIDRWDREATS